MMGRVSRAPVLLIPALALLLAPATAAADTAAPGGLQAAVDSAAAGTTITLAPGDYPDSVTIPAAKSGLVLDGSSGARLLGPLTVDAVGTVLRRVTLAPSAAGVTVGASGGATLDRVLGTRTAGGDVPLVRSAGSLAASDSTLVSTTGDAIAATGAATTIVRSTVATTEAGSDAVQASNDAAGDRAVTADSSILIGGAQGGAGVRATTSGASVPAPAPIGFSIGAVTVTLRHSTVVGASAGLALASGAAVSGGAVTANVVGSIVHPASTMTSSQLGGAPATLNSAASDGPGLQQNTPNGQLFGPNFRLRADAPAIGRGGGLAGGESTTDIDGQPRATPTDIGADQFVNSAPTTGMTVNPGVVDEGQTVTAVLTPTDRDPGDAIPTYAFNWGDGTQTVGASPTATHVYAKPGVYSLKGAVADARNAPSNVVIAPVTVRDVTAPAVTVTAPKAGTKLRYKRSRRLRIKGTDTDATGVAKVEIALTRKVGKRCRQYGKKAFKKARCSKLTFRRATLKDSSFSLRTRKGVRLGKGAYTIRIRTLDGVGNASKGYAAERGTLVRFTVR